MSRDDFTEWLFARGTAGAAVDAERLKQFNKWGPQNHKLSVYLTILSEEVGELAEEILNQELGYKGGDRPELLEEAIQVAAVAQAIVQRIQTGSA